MSFSNDYEPGLPDSNVEEEYWLQLLSDLGSEPSVPLSMRPSPQPYVDEHEIPYSDIGCDSPQLNKANKSICESEAALDMNNNIISNTNTNKEIKKNILPIPHSPSRSQMSLSRISKPHLTNSTTQQRVSTPTYPPPPPPPANHRSQPASSIQQPPANETENEFETDEEPENDLPDMWGDTDSYVSDKIDFIFCSDNKDDYEDPSAYNSQSLDALALCRSSLVQLQPVLRNAVNYAAGTVKVAGEVIYASAAYKLATSKALSNTLNQPSPSIPVSVQDTPRYGPSLGSLHQTILFLARHLDSIALSKYVRTASGSIVTLRDIAIMHIARYVRSNVYLSSFVGCVHESTLFMVDRLRAGVELYSHILQGDDPEKMHLELLKDKPDWQHLLLRCSMASLTWKQRQLLEETRDGGTISSIDFQRLIQSQILEFDRQRVAKIAKEYFYLSPETFRIQSDMIEVKKEYKQGKGEMIYITEGDDDEGEKGNSRVNTMALKAILTDTTSIDQLTTRMNNNTMNNNTMNNASSMYNTSSNPKHNPTTTTTNVEEEVGEDSLETDFERTKALGALKTNIHSWLVEEASLGDEDAQYALARFFTPPAFTESSGCTICERNFSITLFRHHCRFCARSVCDDHSRERRCIYRYGIVTPVRVCRSCAESIDETHRMDGIIWRDLRVSAYLRNKLIPYFTPAVDRGIDKVFRVADYSITVARNALTYNFPARLALDTVEVLKRYGLTGFTGLLLRKDFLESVELLKRISGMESMFTLSLHELTACVYYKLAIERGLRGSHPDSELLAHAPHSSGRSSGGGGSSSRGTNNNNTGSSGSKSSPNKNSSNAHNTSSTNTSNSTNSSGDYDCKDAEDSDIAIAIRFAPLALNIIYEENPVDCQRLAKLQGWNTIFTNVETDLGPEQPCYTLFGASFPDTSLVEKVEITSIYTGKPPMHAASTTSRTAGSATTVGASLSARATAAAAVLEKEPSGNKDEAPPPTPAKPAVLEAVLVIRGTQTIQDVVTDIRAAPQMFPPPAEEIDAALRGIGSAHNPTGVGHPAASSNNEEQNTSPKMDAKQGSTTSWDWLAVPSHHTYACGGMVRAAMHILREVGPALRRLHSEGYQIYLAGHSLGGSVAALLTYMLQTALPTVRCITYGCPSCVDAVTSDILRERVISVVLHDDVISRITPQTIRLLMRELMVFREQMFQHLQAEWVDVLKRAAGLWTPRWRLTGGTGSSNGTQSTAQAFATARNSGTLPMPGTPQQAAPVRIRPAELVEVTVASLAAASSSSSSSNSEEHTTTTAAVPESTKSNTYTHPPATSTSPTATDATPVMVDEEELTQLWLPGRVIHIYINNGQCFASEVSRTFPDLRVIALQGNIFEDHRSENIQNALLEVRSVRTAPYKAPTWQSYHASEECTCCHSNFTWNSTFTGQAQEYRDKYNCRVCGYLVCDSCSTQRRAVPKYGHIIPKRICDKCLYKGDFASL